MNRSEILKRADEIINGERQTSYGKPEANFEFIANLWTVYLGKIVMAEDVALMMALFKIARCKTGVGTEDSFVDACGYMAIGGEMASENLDKLKRIIDPYEGEEPDEN